MNRIRDEMTIKKKCTEKIRKKNSSERVHALSENCSTKIPPHDKSHPLNYLITLQNIYSMNFLAIYTYI